MANNGSGGLPESLCKQVNSCTEMMTGERSVG